MPPWTGMEPPQTPLLPAAAVTGTIRLVACGEHSGHLFDRARPDHGGGALRDPSLGGPTDGDGPPVAPRLGPGVIVVHDDGPGVGQALEQALGDGGDRRTEPVGRRRRPDASMGVTGVGSVMGGPDRQ